MPRSACCRRCGSATRPAPGAGRVVDVNLVDSVFSLMEGMLPEYALDGRVRQPVGAAIETAAPTNTYPCADGKWLCIAGNSDLIFARLMAAIGRPELARDPAYATNADRCAHRARRWTRRSPPGPGRCRRRRPRRGWRRRTCRARGCIDIADCADDPHFRARDVGAGGGRSADRPDAASGAGDPARRRRAGGGCRLARSGGGRAYPEYVLRTLLGLSRD